jgi:hypothetical protein
LFLRLLPSAVPRTTGRRLNPEIVELLSGSELCGQPAWLFPATRPSLGWLRWIFEFRKNPRIRSPRVAYVFVIPFEFDFLFKLAKALFEVRFFGH